MKTRAYWMTALDRISRPVLNYATEGKLISGPTPMESVCRTVCGLAAWLELDEVEGEEKALQARYRELVPAAVSNLLLSPKRYFHHPKETGPSSTLVELAMLALACLRAPKHIVGALDEETRAALIAALEDQRRVQPFASNWLLFSGLLEALLCRLEQRWDPMRVDYAVKQHLQWYKGDGVYGDGSHFHFDYYNSLVIHPMLLQLVEEVGSKMPLWKTSYELGNGKTKDIAGGGFQDQLLIRAQRYGEVLERLISPEGTYPCLGRSIAYRFGAFHLLAHLALNHQLPATLPPAQVRCAITAVLKRQMEAPGMFNEEGYLNVGFYGHQPSIGENYMYSGSLYHCTYIFIALGLPASDPFWADPDCAWTNLKAWSGEDLPPDHSLETNI